MALPPSDPSDAPGDAPTEPRVLHRERLRVPLRWWVLSSLVIASAFLALVVALPVLATLALTAVVAAAVLGGVWRWGSTVVEVRDGRDAELVAGRARLPLAVLGDVEELDAERTRLVVGREADARAYLVYRGWLPQAVRVGLDDPRDPTPYWVVSTRHPERLAAALRSAGHAGRAAGSRPTA